MKNIFEQKPATQEIVPNKLIIMAIAALSFLGLDEATAQGILEQPASDMTEQEYIKEVLIATQEAYGARLQMQQQVMEEGRDTTLHGVAYRYLSMPYTVEDVAGKREVPLVAYYAPGREELSLVHDGGLAQRIYHNKLQTESDFAESEKATIDTYIEGVRLSSDRLLQMAEVGLEQYLNEYSVEAFSGVASALEMNVLDGKMKTFSREKKSIEPLPDQQSRRMILAIQQEYGNKIKSMLSGR